MSKAKLTEADWNSKPCPKCGGQMDIFRSLPNGEKVGFYECRQCHHLERGKDCSDEDWESISSHF